MSRLEELRKQRGYSQTYVAGILQITQQAYSNYENNRREPDHKTLKKMSELFETTSDYILGITDENIPLKFSETSVEFLPGVTDDPAPPSAKSVADPLENDPGFITMKRLYEKSSQKDKNKMTKVIQALFDEAFPEDTE